MVSGIPTSSGYEERIKFAEMGVVESGAIEHGVLSTLPEGNYIHGWDVNVAGVRITSVKRNIRHHPHAVSGYCQVMTAMPGIAAITDPLFLGVYPQSEEEGRAAVFHWQKIWRFLKAA